MLEESVFKNCLKKFTHTPIWHLATRSELALEKKTLLKPATDKTVSFCPNQLLGVLLTQRLEIMNSTSWFKHGIKKK